MPAPDSAPSTPAKSSFQPANTLKSRTFIGLLVAQFLAAFNDQAIHASAMFFALKTGALNEAQAISLMPILFFAPWAIFCTLSGYYADKYSKQYSLIFWKIAEVLICGVALAGFFLGTHGSPYLGTWIVLSTVFLMGMHSAFFVPAKYGVMPEILQPHLLSKGNGLLESLSFLAVILGTVCGGILSQVFERREEYIGMVLLGLAIIGAIASLVIQRMPAADPNVSFPSYIYKPLMKNLQTLFRSKPLRLAVIGIAFFTFVVAFMRQTVYMLGESQNPRWGEFKTSVIVGTVALGIGLGSPLAGWLSGRKVELGLIPVGGIGMIIGCLIAAMTLSYIPGLIVCIVLIGFNTGFYLVPMYTLLQYRAPKSSKGNMIATSNFINVTGAIAASLLFFVLVTAAKQTGFVPEVPTEDIATGKLDRLYLHSGHPIGFRVQPEDGGKAKLVGVQGEESHDDAEQGLDTVLTGGHQAPKNLVIHMDRVIQENDEVTVARHELRGVEHFWLRPKGTAPEIAYDSQKLPEFLFIGAGMMTLLTLGVLVYTLRDLLARAAWFLKALTLPRVRVDALKNLPGSGPIILVTNSNETQKHRSIVAATDRFTRFFAETERDEKAVQEAIQCLHKGDLVGLTMSRDEAEASFDAFIQRVQAGLSQPADFVPVFCGKAIDAESGGSKVLRIIFGEKLAPTARSAELERAMSITQRLPME